MLGVNRRRVGSEVSEVKMGVNVIINNTDVVMDAFAVNMYISMATQWSQAITFAIIQTLAVSYFKNQFHNTVKCNL